MFQKILTILFGSKYERDLKRLNPIVETINSFEVTIKAMDDETLSSQTKKFKERLASGETLDDILPEAFATVREVAYRTLGMRHFDVQMMGGISLHWGNISEMKTGEGKTLTSTLPIYLNSLSGEGVHVVTVNDYLAKRDANWMRPVFEFLKVSVGVIQHDMDHEERKVAYNSDITYGTNNEFGFDYLRDNMVSYKEHRVQRQHNFAIVDEVDSILIDEARTPLIISGPAEESTDKYLKVNKIIPKLVEGEDFEIDEKAKNVILSEAGVHHVEKLLEVDNLYHAENIELVHHVQQALKAHKIFFKDKDYVVQDGEVIIVDEFTGRLMKGRRYSDGLHQSLEAKEGVPIARESQTLASITFQNYFRIYKKLAGMTGTADTEAEEFKKIYNLDVIVIPSNLKIQRQDMPDRVYKTEREKFDAVVKDIQEKVSRKQPVLVGTISIEKSEVLSKLLFSHGIQHNVLNAKQHERESEIVANAGKPGAITIATNMAGRGTDIVLGGAPKYKDDLEKLDDKCDSLGIKNKEELEIIYSFRECLIKQKFDEAEGKISDVRNETIKKECIKILGDAKKWKVDHDFVIGAGGLHIIGSERHESRRIDNQLRGRSGRQGDPGSSRFYLSLQDDLMRIFGSDRIARIMDTLKMPEGQELEHSMVSNAIARAQKRVEGHNFDIRKHLLEYDDVMNRQRIYIYGIRNELLDKGNMSKTVFDFFDEVVENQVILYCEGNNADAWEIDSLNEWLQSLGIDHKIESKDFKKESNPQLKVFEVVSKLVKELYDYKVSSIGDEIWRSIERNVFLDILDHRWKEHLYAMDHLKEGIWTVGYGEKNPLIEYKLQGFKMFDQLVDNLKNEVVSFLLKIEVTESDKKQDDTSPKEYKKIGQEQRAEVDMFGNELKSNKTKPQVSSTTSSGGGSERRSSRRKK
ncbi:Preprotein translocase, SecA subunit [Leptospira biflexa serovar Patoc strain 'Patoc 1 (Ames)']|uniref:Protein translocase subunit SecA n=2 Tax=Leptospira biflexa serovar Patoc TaxID=145259 RepID=SECA_LEPBP|nr:preprotein translocase subunit SecA [Leptospira biflexa]B0SEW5.1 RecName: Full=Protein translocase subunit SecA [Leptospira biflexa serovar Patoc strain 'Patoc 1 (Ames)']B0SNG1.1 RecName: Full=Protein translocase subunit SecA [Leptospira biflexa serovar Patoc strain 'Patoc 1 (Paris)']ABZ95239.1 Preprotein translocase, SecA subunit [Leptospira biflexa serovar Patoc strain 'Patoc 1 (Ames)']ABZ98928.1 Preprotein translocase SecA subunit [Leptospira biflexa serovar Patoc strain 'Patoc 1 (Paris)'